MKDKVQDQVEETIERITETVAQGWRASNVAMSPRQTEAFRKHLMALIQPLLALKADLAMHSVTKTILIPKGTRLV